MTDRKVTRVRYYERQVLRLRDFTEEQRYHLAMRRRHNIGMHRWGIVQGLDLTYDENESQFFVEPGLAIDGYGRELILPTRYPISQRLFSVYDSDTLDVWLLYIEKALATEQSRREVCDDSQDPNDRVLELGQVELTAADPARRDRRRPQNVPESDLDFDATRPPADGESRWPVFLGQVMREPVDPDRREFVFRFESNDRPYAGLQCQTIESPSGRASVQLDSELATDPYQFAVRIGSDSPIETKTAPSLFVDANHDIGVRGDTTVHGDVSITGGNALVLREQTDTELPLRPWQLYHRVGETEGEAETGESNLSEEQRSRPTTHELRLVIEGREPFTDANNASFVVGRSEDDQFKPALTVGQDGNVVVHGNLKVEGQIEKTDTADDAIDPSTQQVLSSLFQSTILGGTQLSESSEQVTAFLDRSQGRRFAANELTKRKGDELAVALVKDERLAELIRQFDGVAEADLRLPSALTSTLNDDEESDFAREAIAKGVADASDQSELQTLVRNKHFDAFVRLIGGVGGALDKWIEGKQIASELVQETRLKQLIRQLADDQGAELSSSLTTTLGNESDNKSVREAIAKGVADASDQSKLQTLVQDDHFDAFVRLIGGVGGALDKWLQEKRIASELVKDTRLEQLIRHLSEEEGEKLSTDLTTTLGDGNDNKSTRESIIKGVAEASDGNDLQDLVQEQHFDAFLTLIGGLDNALAKSLPEEDVARASGIPLTSSVADVRDAIVQILKRPPGEDGKHDAGREAVLAALEHLSRDDDDTGRTALTAAINAEITDTSGNVSKPYADALMTLVGSELVPDPDELLGELADSFNFPEHSGEDVSESLTSFVQTLIEKDKLDDVLHQVFAAGQQAAVSSVLAEQDAQEHLPFLERFLRNIAGRTSLVHGIADLASHEQDEPEGFTRLIADITTPSGAISTSQIELGLSAAVNGLGDEQKKIMLGRMVKFGEAVSEKAGAMIDAIPDSGT